MKSRRSRFTSVIDLILGPVALNHGVMPLYHQVGTEENGKRVIKVVKLQPRPAAKVDDNQLPAATSSSSR